MTSLSRRAIGWISAAGPGRDLRTDPARPRCRRGGPVGVVRSVGQRHHAHRDRAPRAGDHQPRHIGRRSRRARRLRRPAPGCRPRCPHRRVRPRCRCLCGAAQADPALRPGPDERRSADHERVVPQRALGDRSGIRARRGRDHRSAARAAVVGTARRVGEPGRGGHGRGGLASAERRRRRCASRGDLAHRAGSSTHGRVVARCRRSRAGSGCEQPGEFPAGVGGPSRAPRSWSARWRRGRVARWS